MGASTFEAVLKRPAGVGIWTILTIPLEVSSTFGTKAQVKVKGTINDYPFRSTALPTGDGTHYLVVSKAIRDHIQANQGDTVKVGLEIDTEVRKAEIPEELRQALTHHPEDAKAFERMTFSHQTEWINWIMSAKQTQTRLRRIEKALTLISQGKNRRDLSPRK